MELQGKKIILGICGSIAAYKSAMLCRLLVKNGAEVRVVMTPSAEGFITSLTMSTLSRHGVYNAIHDGHSWSGHVELGLWADLMLVAPASANTIAHMANGMCDSMLDAVYLSAKCPVFFAPAMDLDMWRHPSTESNIRKLSSFGNRLIPVEHGFLASGLTGDGRMAEPEHIYDHIVSYFRRSQDLEGKKVLITAGPTHEKIDPVRFIGNSSSGKMGISIVKECLGRGASVDLVLGPVSEVVPQHPSLSVHHVTSAGEMYQACRQYFGSADIAIMAAAVADYKPGKTEQQKIKKAEGVLELELVKTVDIAATLGKEKKPHQLTIGFALETENELEYAMAKRAKKNFDLIVLNSTRDKGATFGTDTNKVTIIGEQGVVKETELLSKDDIARIIVDETIKLL